MNKFISKIVIILTAFSLAGCQREILREESAASGQIAQITAYYADANSKTVLSDDGTKVLWNPGDEIAVFFNGNKYTYYSINTRPKDKAIFVAYDNIGVGLEPISEPYIYAVYPEIYTYHQNKDTLSIRIPFFQLAVTGSFDQRSFISVGRSKDTNIAFYNLCGGICFSVSEPNVQHIIIRGNCNEYLAGNVNVMFDEDGYPGITSIEYGYKRIELLAPSEEGFEVGKKYYITMLPVSLPNGFTMTFIKETSKATLSTTSDVSVKRSTFGNLGVADLGLEYVEVTPQAVDLGLSVKWATFNIGATAPEECGIWFKFGEVKGTIWNDVWRPDMVFPEYEIDTTDYHLLPQYDAAAVNWGSGWRMPSKAESDELYNNTTQEWKYDDGPGVYGCLFTSNVPGYTDKSIFLPGQKDYLIWYNWYYWSGTSCQEDPDSSAFFIDEEDAYYTFTKAFIRPVIE